jgi:hypothetical protein
VCSLSQAKGSIALCVRVKYYTRKNEKFVSTGFLDDRIVRDPDWYAILSSLWLEDPQDSRVHSLRSWYSCVVFLHVAGLPLRSVLSVLR